MSFEEHIRENTDKPDASKSDTSKPEISKSEASKSDTGKLDTVKSEASKSDISKPEASKSDMTSGSPGAGEGANTPNPGRVEAGSKLPSSPAEDEGAKLKRLIFNLPLAIILVLLTAGVSFLPWLSSSDSVLGISFLNVIFAAPLAVIVYFLVRKQAPRVVWTGVLVGFCLLVVYTNFLIGMGGIYAETSKFVLPILMARYIPLIIFLIIGFAYAGNDWRSAGARLDYLKYCGEFGVYAWFWGMILGAIAALPLGYFMAGVLLSSMGDSVVSLNWPKVWVMLWFPAAVFLVGLAIYLVNARLKTGRKLPGTLANFGFVLLTVILLYLITLLAMTFGSQVGPLTASGGFLVFLLMLFAVLAERDTEERVRMSDYANLIVCLVAELLVLVGIVVMLVMIFYSHLSVYWLTFLGDFLVVFINLAGIIYLYFRFIRHGWDFGRVQKWVTDYLEVYFVWVVLVSVVSPLMFLFR